MAEQALPATTCRADLLQKQRHPPDQQGLQALRHTHGVADVRHVESAHHCAEGAGQRKLMNRS